MIIFLKTGILENTYIKLVYLYMKIKLLVSMLTSISALNPELLTGYNFLYN